MDRLRTCSTVLLHTRTRRAQSAILKEEFCCNSTKIVPEAPETGCISLQTKVVTKTKTSKSHSEKYRSNLSDNRVSAGFRPNLKEMVYPIIWKKAKGAYFWDLDGNKYTDFTF